MLGVFYAEIGKRAVVVFFAGNSYDLLKRVIRFSRHRKKGVAGAKQGKKPGGEGVSAVYKVYPHQRRLSPEYVGVHAVKHLAPAVVVAVA